MTRQAAPQVPSRSAITAERLRAINPRLSLMQAGQAAAGLDASRPLGELLTPLRVRHYLGQIGEETFGFTRLVESLNYRDPVRLDRLFSRVDGVSHAAALIRQGQEAIANCVYANRMGNGPPESGDGWRFRGRGPLQITGRENYRKIGEAIGLPLEAKPELLADWGTGAQAAARYWAWKKINIPADHDDLRGVTSRINPALAGLEGRIAWTRAAARVFP